MAVTLYLPEDIARWVPSRSWLRVDSSSQPRLEAEGARVPIDVRYLPSLSEPGVLARASTRTSSTETRSLLVIAGSHLPRQLTDDLEAAELGYVDSTGRLHLPWAHGVIHVEPHGKDRAGKDRAAPRVSQRTLGVHGVRAVQAMLEHPSDIKVSVLAARAALSASRVHTVLTMLEDEGLIRTTGSGPATTRDVVDRGRLLDWLAAQPAARRRERAVNAAVYARLPSDLLLRVRRALGAAEIAYALTAGAAAIALGAGPTNLLTTSVRISPETTLEAAFAAIGGEQTDRGANLRLIHDVGSVGTHETVERNGVHLAPRPRIYLDLLAERRGADLAAHFRETVLGY